MSENREGWFEKTDRLIVNILRVLSNFSGIFLIGIMFVAFFNVLGEKLFHHGIPMSTELIQYFHVPVVFLAACYVTLDNGHTTIDILSSHFPRAVQKVCNTIGCLLGIVMCSFVGVMGISRMTQAIANHTKSSTTGAGFPIWPFIFIFVVGFFLLAISFLWALIRLYCKKEEPVVKKPEEGGAE
ncbi:MAG: TRAP transporter small permease subunit [Eubacterium sp.]|nr:TRAP transporter small permease subunit [Eubacterium sp.]